MLFTNRIDAGRRLALRVDQYLNAMSTEDRSSNIVVVGLPRGGVPVALEVARKFCCPLDIIVAKKLPFPNQPEYAIGAVSSGGVVVLSPDIPQTRNWKDYVEFQKKNLIATTQRREEEFYTLANREKSSFENKIAILVDDGIATGMTALAAIQTAKQRGAREVYIAAPVMSKESFTQLREFCNGVIATYVPDEFNAVGQFYIEFYPTSNEEVVQCLKIGGNMQNCPAA